jgi:plastocyanin
MSRSRLAVLASLAVLSAVFLAACGGTSTTAPPSAPAVPAGSSAALTITAKDIAYSPANLSAPAGSQLQIRFDNQDAGVPHNLGLYGDAGFSTKLYESAIKTGPAVEDITIPGLVPGTYQFRCSVHPNMTATLTVGS